MLSTKNLENAGVIIPMNAVINVVRVTSIIAGIVPLSLSRANLRIDSGFPPVSKSSSGSNIMHIPE